MSAAPARRARLVAGVARLLRPATPEPARQVTQEPVFRAAAAVAPPRGRCLNAGSGTLGLYNSFLESFLEITEIVNVDVRKPQISSHRADPRHTDLEGSVTDLPFADGAFDWVLCSNVFPVVHEHEVAARELARVLSPRGAVLISVRTADAPVAAYRVSASTSRAREGYSLESLEALLGDAGLEVFWHRYCFFLPMTWLFRVWRWQYERLGRGRRTVMPRAAVLAFGYADRWLRVGRPSDLTVLARHAR